MLLLIMNFYPTQLLHARCQMSIFFTNSKGCSASTNAWSEWEFRQRLERTLISSPKLHDCKWRILPLILIFCGFTTARMCHGCARVQCSLGKHRTRGFTKKILFTQRPDGFLTRVRLPYENPNIMKKTSFFQVFLPYPPSLCTHNYMCTALGTGCLGLCIYYARLALY